MASSGSSVTQETSQKEILGFVRLERYGRQQHRSPKTIKSFWVGEVVLRERPLVVAEKDDDLHRILAYIRTTAKSQSQFLAAFADLELKDREVWVDPSQVGELVEAVLQQGGSTRSIEAVEAAAALSRWRYAALIDSRHFYEKASALRHSCGAEVNLAVCSDSGAAELTSRYALAGQLRIGIWQLDDVSMWWRGANVRASALQRAGLFKEDCACERCQGDDICRAMKCPGCAEFQRRLTGAKAMMLLCTSAMRMACFISWRRVIAGANLRAIRGEVVRNGRLKRWRCTLCDFDASDKVAQGYLKTETQLINELWDLAMPEEQLAGWVATLESRMGLAHWLAPHLWFEIYRLQVEQLQVKGQGGVTLTAVLASLRIFEWMLNRKLSTPPQALLDQLADMIFKTLDFLHTSTSGGGVRDLRVLFLRTVDTVRILIESMDKRLLERFTPFAGAAQNIRRRCAFCQRFLTEEAPDLEDTEISAEGMESGPVYCSKCMDLCYCDRDCQISDWRRHRHYCIPIGMDFMSPDLEQIVMRL